MSMIKCGECGADVSSKAENCPSCGVRIAPKQVGCFASFLVIGGALALVALVVGGPESQKDYAETCTQPSQEEVRSWDVALEQYGKAGMFTEYRQDVVGTIPTVSATVGRAFVRSSIDEKRILAVLLWNRHFECVNEDGIVMFTDPRTGKSVGVYTPKIGLSMD